MLRPGITRFILAVLVIVSHFSNAVMLGKFAVCCFFILSGYWIAVMYDKRYSKKENKVAVFYVSRLWRIFPMYYLFSILAIISTALFNPSILLSITHLALLPKLSAIAANLFIVGDTDAIHRILGPSWSLDVEILFYLIFPVFAYISERKNSLFFTMFFLLASLSIYVYFKERFEYNFMSYLFLFLAGTLVYKYKISFTSRFEKVSAIVFTGLLACQYLIRPLHKDFMDEKSYYYFLTTLALIVAAIPMLINSVYAPTNAADKALGELSYIIYLSHWVWIQPYQVMVWGNPSYHTSGKAVFASIVLLLTAASSWLAYKYIDRSFEKRRHKWVSLQQEAVAEKVLQ
jgi:peptidoglycan/LPS O-acetylase OafA/YrhL